MRIWWGPLLFALAGSLFFYFYTSASRAQLQAKIAESKPAAMTNTEEPKPRNRVESSEAVLVEEAHQRWQKECKLIADDNEELLGVGMTVCDVTVVHVPPGHKLVEYQRGEEDGRPKLITRKGSRVYYWRVGSSSITPWVINMIFQEHPDAPTR